MGIFKTRNPPKHLATATVLVDSSRARSAAWRMHAADTRGVATDQARVVACVGGWAETFSLSGRMQSPSLRSLVTDSLAGANEIVNEAPGWDGITLVHDGWVNDPQPYAHVLTGEIFLTPDNNFFTSFNWDTRRETYSLDAMLLGLATLYEQSIAQISEATACSILLMAMQTLGVVMERDPSSFLTAETTAAAVARIFDVAVDLVAAEVERMSGG